MTISSAVLKGLLGVGAVSTVAIGGIYLYKNKQVEEYSGIDKFAFDKERLWEVEIDPTISPTSGKEVKIVLKLKDEGNENKNWKCSIKGQIPSNVNSPQLNIINQAQELKKEIGIDTTGKRTKTYSFKKLFDKCIEKRNNGDKKDNSSESTIDLKTLVLGIGGKHKFDENKFKELFEGTKEILKKVGFSTDQTPKNTIHDVSSNNQSIKFSNGGILEIPNGTNVKVKIEETDDTNTFPEGLKFTFVNDKDIKIKKENKDLSTIKANTNTEFKLKINGNDYSLEEAWNIASFAKKAGLECHTSETNKNKCTLKENSKINVYQSPNNYTKEATFTLDEKTISFTEGERGYNQGFKLKVSGDINLKSGSNSSSWTDPKLLNENRTYEIGTKTVSGSENWFLIEKEESKVFEDLVNLSCTTSESIPDMTICCSTTKDKTLKGLILKSGETLTRTKVTDDKYPNGFKYSLTPSSGDAKNYKIDCSGDECTLKEVV